MLPGIFDPHVHIGNERSFEEEAETETRAAVLGGVTTIGIFLRSLEESYIPSSGISPRDGRAELRRFGVSIRRYSPTSSRRDSALCKGVRHPFLQILYVGNAGHREIDYR